ncbi:DinB family protein [Ktedonosporobacter rubrisoli]|uniref:DinB family protein n=1 Tax=Ktedonosporobacter rubrisoli TaxID=2509675 RepID=A0A4P6JM81_KTERU|nr:DinB family protein [Ktedonosporobacter rubrisoli]QBD75776.1 DinB family protein [Ktedonosporobacter rubrisoli]
MKTIHKPQEGDYVPYTIMYLDLLPDDGLVLQHMLDSLQTIKALILPLSEEQLTRRCAPGEWTIKEILVHMSDDERILVNRTLRVARNDPAPLLGFDPDLYAAYSGANERRIEDILEEVVAVRMATVALLKSFDEEALERESRMQDHRVTVRALVYHIAGHFLLHLNSIKQNYLAESI